MLKSTWRPFATAAAALGLMIAGFGAVAAETAEAPQTINACYHKNQGQLRFIDSQAADWQELCRPPEVPMSWNQQGIQGETGPQGPQGETGPQGPQGETGPQGAQGETGPQGLQGNQGLQGDTGATGASGAQGEQGPAGPAGTDGVSGLAGQSCQAGAFVTGFSQDGTIVCSDVVVTPGCSPTTLTHTMSAVKVDDFTQRWPGGSVTLGTPDCNVTLSRPTSSILLIGTLGNAWTITGQTGFATAVLTVNTPSCKSPLAIANVTANRPSCSSAFTGFPFYAPVSTSSVTIAAS